MSTILPPIVSRDEIQRRLKSIFPDGTPNRNYCVREMAASTVFSMLYVGAIEGTDTFLAPKHVYRMTDQQALKLDARPREAYASAALRPGFAPRGRRWYADNSREPIRDETLREGLMRVGAVSARSDLATTSARPRYSLARDFAALFDPSLTGSSLERAMSEWRERNLSAGALARVDLLRRGITASEEGVLVRFPNGETRRMAPGPSSDIARHVVEVFATRFLERPGVLWLSESQAKVVHRDDALASRIGLNIDPQKNLPDLILVDLGPADPFLLFVEVVATDGAMTVSRQQALLAIATGAGFRAERVAFVTAYRDRGAAAFKKTVQELAWRSFAWFMSEPEHLVMLVDGTQAAIRLGRLIDLCTPRVSARPAE